jgi:hypothetical protein
MIIEKKILIDYFKQVEAGTKTFELRLADWECQPGDTLVLNEVDANRQPTGRSLRKKVGFVVKSKDIDFFSKEEVDQYGYQVISLLDEAQS